MDTDPYFDEVRVRVAPSPTGEPHVGTAYMAVFNLAYARSAGGKFVLRSEDTDRERSQPEYEDQIVAALRWLGLDHDEGPGTGGPFGPYRQSDRMGLYGQYAEQLVSEGKAYRCFCTKERLDELRETQKANKGRFGYDGFCRGLGAEEANCRAEGGEQHVVRLAVPREGQTAFRDEIRGEDIIFENVEIDDQVLVKADGWPTYHLASVVDDHLMKISDVIRAEEWINSTPKHVLLYESFGWPMPRFFHMPLLRNKNKGKISKRKNPTSLDWYRRQGYLKEALVNFLALQGWSMGDDQEKFSFDEMVAAFDWGRVKTSGPVFDLEKLAWMNGLYLRELPQDELKRLLVDEGFADEGQLQRADSLLPHVQQRMETLQDFGTVTRFVFADALDYEAKLLIPKKKDASFAAEVLAKAKETLAAVDPWNTEKSEAAVRALTEETGWKARDVFMPIRVAVTGSTASPPLFESMETVGKEVCLKRLDEAAGKL